MHHYLDDTFVHPSECYDDKRMPKCNGGTLSHLSSDWCMWVLQLFQSWVVQINVCTRNHAEEENAKGLSLLAISYKEDSKSEVALVQMKMMMMI